MPSGVYERTEQARKRMSEARMGKEPWNKGGTIPSIIGIPRPVSVRKAIGDKQRGMAHSLERRLANSLAQTGKDGSNCNFRKHGDYESPYGVGFTDFFKYMIRNEFGNICVMCHGDGNGHVVEVHHIGDRKNHSIDNLITFCKKCHIFVHADEEFWNGTPYLERQGVIS